ncbi:EAL domain-containing protein [Sulfurivermis fontis]|uniref:sensor domain-containing phosphodiesterase n=1 Tax=Sulfurivermis fontis TaxID=1972068 RepID=UPI001558634A|nr:EAL domain-containing protein [Sulfurivermis fontis]
MCRRASGPPSLLGQLLHDNVQYQGTCATAQFRNYRLSSAFQPIFGLAHRRPVGYEALLRASDETGMAVSPLQVFRSAATDEGTVHLDRTCRLLHAHNYQPLASREHWLFLNINPRVVVEGTRYGPFFSELLRRHQLAPAQVVVEILENEITDEGLLADSVNYYKELGCPVAIDDFGAGHSNFDRILRLAPDMVKLDRGLLQQARHTPTARRMLPNLVSLLHEAGCMVVLEGIEDETEALLALEAGADFAQGYFFARPAAAQHISTLATAAFDRLSRRARDDLHQETSRRNAMLQPIIDAFQRCSADYGAGAALALAAAHLVGTHEVLRCYVLDGDGIQIGSNVTPPGAEHTLHPRYAPLRSTTGSDWSGRPYFRAALAEPGALQITRPYFSITDAAMNVTLSIAMRRDGALHVVCCDIRYP